LEIKTALQISGQIRDAKNCFESVKTHILDKFNPDVFIDTWKPSNRIMDHRGAYIPNEMTIDEVIENYNPKVIQVEDFDTPLMKHIAEFEYERRNAYDGTFPWETKFQNVFYMYYKVWKANTHRCSYENLNDFKYDRVIKSRFDLRFDDFPDIIPEKNTVYVPSGWDCRGGLSDLLAIGDSETIGKYCRLFECLRTYHDNCITLHPESVLRKHLEINNIKIERFDLKYYLREMYLGEP